MRIWLVRNGASSGDSGRATSRSEPGRLDPTASSRGAWPRSSFSAVGSRDLRLEQRPVRWTPCRPGRLWRSVRSAPCPARLPLERRLVGDGHEGRLRRRVRTVVLRVEGLEHTVRQDSTVYLIVLPVESGQPVRGHVAEIAECNEPLGCRVSIEVVPGIAQSRDCLLY